MKKSNRAKHRKEPLATIFHVPLRARIEACILIMRCRVRKVEFQGFTVPINAREVKNCLECCYDILDFAGRVTKTETKRKYQAIASESPCDLGYALGALDVILNVKDLMFRRVGLPELIIRQEDSRFPSKEHPPAEYASPFEEEEDERA
jgi:hypothetical protein